MLQSATSSTLNGAKGENVTRRGLRDITNMAGGGATGKEGAKPAAAKSSKSTFFSSSAATSSLQETTRTAEPSAPSVRAAASREQSASDAALYNRREADDIDARDASNPLMVTHYVQDIYAHMREKETDCVSATYMARQPHINEKMRAILIDWLVRVEMKETSTD